MEVIYSQKARRDIEFWKKSGNKMIMKKITALLIDINLHPYEGLGKPEALVSQNYSRTSTYLSNHRRKQNRNFKYHVFERALRIELC